MNQIGSLPKVKWEQSKVLDKNQVCLLKWSEGLSDTQQSKKLESNKRPPNIFFRQMLFGYFSYMSGTTECVEI